MVVTTVVLRSAKNSIRKRTFLDSLRLHVRAGSGGQGLPKHGGVGGAGGDIFVEGTPDATLESLRNVNPCKRVSAQHGENSLKNRILGAKGGDVTLKVPLGTTLYNDEGHLLGEINKEGDRLLVAKGGVGGCKQTGFSGIVGQKFVLTLDLKLVADVGLVGFPNAGKSTLLSIVSNAKPKIASYPFTTIQPMLGILSYPDFRQITMADLPGLIEGAHVNIGMGHKFLKHVVRTRLLLLVVDASGFQLGPKYQKRSCLETLLLLNKELELYREELLDKPAVLIVNKVDLPGMEQVCKDVLESAQNLKGVMHLVPEQFRPKRALIFNRMLGMSTLSNIPEEVENLKNIIRDVLDETTAQDDDGDMKLFNKISNEYRKEDIILI